MKQIAARLKKLEQDVAELKALFLPSPDRSLRAPQNSPPPASPPASPSQPPQQTRPREKTQS